MSPRCRIFFRRSIDKAPGTDEELTTLVGGERFQVRLLERVACFPGGKIVTGQLAVKLLRGRRQIARRSNNLTIDVREPLLKVAHSATA